MMNAARSRKASGSRHALFPDIRGDVSAIRSRRRGCRSTCLRWSLIAEYPPGLHLFCNRCAVLIVSPDARCLWRGRLRTAQSRDSGGTTAGFGIKVVWSDQGDWKGCLTECGDGNGWFARPGRVRVAGLNEKRQTVPGPACRCRNVTETSGCSVARVGLVVLDDGKGGDSRHPIVSSIAGKDQVCVYRNVGAGTVGGDEGVTCVVS